MLGSGCLHSVIGRDDTYGAVSLLDGFDLDVVDLNHLAIETHDSHENCDEAVLFELLLVVFHAVA